MMRRSGSTGSNGLGGRTSAMAGAILAMMAVTTACPPQGETRDGGAGRMACEPGTRFCLGDTAVQCGDSGVVTSTEVCPVPGTCLAGSCAPDEVCPPGGAFCRLNVLYFCAQSGAGVLRQVDCAHRVCLAGACVDPSGPCPAGAEYCNGNIAYRCNEDGTGLRGAPAPCGDKVCVDGSCREAVCEIGAGVCEEALAQLCNAAGTGWLDGEICPASTICRSGICAELVCEPGPRCNGDQLEICSADGTRMVEVRDCRPGHCTADRCVAADGGPGDVADSSTRDEGAIDLALADRRPDSGALEGGAEVPIDAVSALDIAADRSPDLFLGCIDRDHDLHGVGPACLGTDCDDDNEARNQHAPEVCDGLDNDCNDVVDDLPEIGGPCLVMNTGAILYEFGFRK